MSKVTPEDELITAREAAELLGRNSRTVRRLVLSGDLVPAKKIQGRTGAFLFRRSDVLALSKASA